MKNREMPPFFRSEEELLTLGHSMEHYPHGFIMVIDKPYEWSSGDVVRKVKFLLQKRFSNRKLKVGHAGTLDPLATGILLLAVGRATKLANHFQAEDKEYLTTITLGATTPSYDLEKNIDFHYPVEHINQQLIEETLLQFIGEQEQVPPLFSAKLVDGRRAYELAREGREHKLKPSLITINSIELVEWSSPNLTLKIECSKGTYIRSIARDVGVALKSGGYLTSLIRTKSGSFRVEESLSIEEVEKVFGKKESL